MGPLSEHRDVYKQALQSKDEDALLREKTCLTTAAASALLEQDAEAMRRIRACCADLSALADRFDSTGKPGDRWRTLGDVLTLALESGKPLEQLRLVLPSTVCGMIMKQIKDRPGITPTELSHCFENPKQKSHISNELKKLENAGLIYRFKRGKNHELFLSVLGKEAMDSIAPLRSVPTSSQQEPKRDYPYTNPDRMDRLGQPQLPFPINVNG